MKKSEKISKKQIAFGRVLSSIMKEKKLSLKQIANMAGVSISVVSDWTAGNVPRDLEAVFKLSSALDVEFSMLLLGRIEEKKQSAVLKHLLTEEDLFDGFLRVNIKKVSINVESK
ncbi:hypothetical protein BDW_13885 [Bdellovibrio bacteriovorus W]|nr:hypothetical protein BDW_13885 [Bdellovibrio bacteriovorus W]